MAEVEINYKGSTIASMNASGTKTLLTSGKYCEDNIEIEYTRPSSSGPTLQSKTSKSTGVEQTITADSGYDGLSSVTVSPIIAGVIRPDAELVKTYTYNKLIMSEENIPLPAYNSSSQTTIKAAEALPETYTVDFTNYNYYVVERYVTIPTYSSSTKGKGRLDYSIGAYLFEVTDIPENSFESQSGGKKYANPVRQIINSGGGYRGVYWSSASAISVYTTGSYGIMQIASAPTLSSNVITIMSPDVKVRGQSSYLTSTYYGYITDLRVQYVIDIYRAPKVTNGLNGWGLTTQLTGILSRLYGNNWTL